MMEHELRSAQEDRSDGALRSHLLRSVIDDRPTLGADVEGFLVQRLSSEQEGHKESNRTLTN